MFSGRYWLKRAFQKTMAGADIALVYILTAEALEALIPTYDGPVPPAISHFVEDRGHHVRTNMRFSIGPTYLPCREAGLLYAGVVSVNMSN
jgi:hypothetical protein